MERMERMERTANFSPCRRYRYALWRTWGGITGYAMFVGLNTQAPLTKLRMTRPFGGASRLPKSGATAGCA